MYIRLLVQAPWGRAHRVEECVLASLRASALFAYHGYPGAILLSPQIDPRSEAGSSL